MVNPGIAKSLGLEDLRDLAERSTRRRGSYLRSLQAPVERRRSGVGVGAEADVGEQAPVGASNQKCRNFRSHGRETSSMERLDSDKGAEEEAHGGEEATFAVASSGVASDQSVVTSDRTGRERLRTSEVQQRQGSREGKRDGFVRMPLPRSLFSLNAQTSCDVGDVANVRRARLDSNGSTNAPQQMWYASRAKHGSRHKHDVNLNKHEDFLILQEMTLISSYQTWMNWFGQASRLAYPSAGPFQRRILGYDVQVSRPDVLPAELVVFLLFFQLSQQSSALDELGETVVQVLLSEESGLQMRTRHSSPCCNCRKINASELDGSSSTTSVDNSICQLDSGSSSQMDGFDVIGEHTGDDHDRNIMVPFGGKPSGSEGPGRNRLPTVPFDGKTIGAAPVSHPTALEKSAYRRFAGPSRTSKKRLLDHPFRHKHRDALPPTTSRRRVCRGKDGGAGVYTLNL
ncbi:hypothetical protein M5K25_026348 [Dendrobium thyrsiflorum]|uniref:Uncharacterized protein n=1 Tax=Dendrobium thyrsiflorum TaxID=117978 RepID=A0ABD0TX83_DENTH